MSAYSAAAADEDGDEILALKKRVAELEEQLDAVGAGGVGPLVPKSGGIPPDCGACPGNGTVCPSSCRLAEESPPSTTDEFPSACQDDTENPTNIDSPMNACMYQASCKRWRDQATTEDSSVLQDKPVAWLTTLGGKPKEVTRTKPNLDGFHETWSTYPLYIRPQHAIPEGWKMVPVETLEELKHRVNTLAALTTKRERHQFGIRVKREIADLLAAAPQPPQADTGIPTSELPAQWVGLDYSTLLRLAGDAGLGPKHVSGLLQARLEIYGRAIESALRQKNAGAQARQPLTDEQIVAVFQSTRYRPSSLTVRLIRAIERAHGITSKEGGAA